MTIFRLVRLIPMATAIWETTIYVSKSGFMAHWHIPLSHNDSMAGNPLNLHFPDYFGQKNKVHMLTLNVHFMKTDSDQ